MLHASPYGKRTEECDCPPGTGLACPHLCRYSAPEGDWNWESSQAAWVFGYRFYEFTAARGAELPLCIGMPTKPQQNDAITGYVCLLQYHQLIGRPLRMVLFDSAHDNEPTYRLVRDLSAIPVIDLNSGNTGSGDRRSVSAASTPVARRTAPLAPCAGKATPAAISGSSALRRRRASTARMPPPALVAASISSLR